MTRRTGRPPARGSPPQAWATIATMTNAKADRLWFTEDDEANALLASDPMALLIGFLLDQQSACSRRSVARWS